MLLKTLFSSPNRTEAFKCHSELANFNNTFLIHHSVFTPLGSQTIRFVLVWFFSLLRKPFKRINRRISRFTVIKLVCFTIFTMLRVRVDSYDIYPVCQMPVFHLFATKVSCVLIITRDGEKKEKKRVDDSLFASLVRPVCARGFSGWIPKNDLLQRRRVVRCVAAFLKHLVVALRATNNSYILTHHHQRTLFEVQDGGYYFFFFILRRETRLATLAHKARGGVLYYTLRRFDVIGTYSYKNACEPWKPSLLNSDSRAKVIIRSSSSYCIIMFTFFFFQTTMLARYTYDGLAVVIFVHFAFYPFESYREVTRHFAHHSRFSWRCKVNNYTFSL